MDFNTFQSKRGRFGQKLDEGFLEMAERMNLSTSGINLKAGRFINSLDWTLLIYGSIQFHMSIIYKCIINFQLI